jgi:hypothetical protein
MNKTRTERYSAAAPKKISWTVPSIESVENSDKEITQIVGPYSVKIAISGDGKFESVTQITVSNNISPINGKVLLSSGSLNVDRFYPPDEGE